MSNYSTTKRRPGARSRWFYDFVYHDLVVNGRKSWPVRSDRGSHETYRRLAQLSLVRAQPDCRARERAARAGRAASRGRGDDQRLVAAGHEMLRNAEGAVGYPVDVGRQGFGHDRYPHVHQVNYAVSPQDVTPVMR